MRHPSRRIAASKQSRYLRDVSRAVEALVLSAWYAPVVRPSSHLQASLPALRCSSDGKAALSEPVLAEMLAVVSYTMESDGSLGPARSRSRSPEVRAAMSEGISQAMFTADGLSGLSSLLGLDDAPMSLETFDISHLYGTNTVGACSALSLGMTALDQYCCYPIRGVAPADDTGAISAALREHLGSGARPPPSVLLIDGGKGQLSAALTVLNELGLGDTVGLLAIAKREEELYVPHASGPIVLPRTDPTLTLLRRQRDEAHAFALLSHRLLRASSATDAGGSHAQSVLDGCGLTASEQVRLRASFGSARALRSASLEEIGAVLGEGSSADPTRVLSRLRSRPEPSDVGFHASLAGHPSAVQALALSGRRASAQIEAWGMEEQARKWWAVRRGVWLSRLERGGGAAARAVDDVLEAVGGVLAPATPLESEQSKLDASANLQRALAAWGAEGALQQEARGVGAASGASGASEVRGASSARGAQSAAQHEAASRSASVVAMPGAFKLHAPYPAAGDQPAAIDKLVSDVQAGTPRVVLRGATGTGKTFVLANLIARTNRPTLIMAPNKVLAAQLFSELKVFFPQNSVTIFFSHFDFYRPESYAPVSQSYVEKSSQTNPKIDALRHAATRSLFERRDTIVIATVSCIYGLGMPTEYLDRATALSVGQHWKASELVAALRKMRYEHATGRVGRGEYLWSSSSGDAAEVGGGAAWLTLSVHLVHEDRVLDVDLQVVAASEGEGVDGVDGGDGSDDGDDMEYGTFDLDLNLDLDLDPGQLGQTRDGASGGSGAGVDGGLMMVVRELQYRDSGAAGDLAPVEAAEAGTEALIQAVLKQAAVTGQPAGEAVQAAEGGAVELLAPLSKAEVRALKVAELRAACAERELSTDGLKPALAARLNAHEARSVGRAAAAPAGTGTRAEAAAGVEAASEGERPTHVVLYPASHYTAGQEAHKERVLRDIADECASAVAALLANGQVAEAERLRYRTESDLADIAREGYCSGMENYSRHLTGRQPGEAPPTLLDYMPDDWLFVVDESHIAVPQLGAMYSGDHSRKLKLVENGFRLPSALDNRPLKGEEVWQRVPQAVLVSATPGAEVALCGPSPRLTELVVRPTGILDPEVHVVDVLALGGYEDHLLAQIAARAAVGERTLVTCITKSSAEALSSFLNSHGVASLALHSGVKPLERLRFLEELKRGRLDVLVGCNLLREGLDLPEVSLVCVLSADKQGLLRSATSLVQTIGRAARHVHGAALLYTDSGRTSEAMEQAIAETERRRARQLAFNAEHGATPRPAGTLLGAAGTKPRSAERGGGGSIFEMLRSDKPGGRSGDRGPPGGELEGDDRAVYDELRAWRGQVARAGTRRRRPFMILTEAAMQGIALARPSDMGELLEVKGIGPKKAEQYGEAILQIVRESKRVMLNGHEFELA